MPAFGETSQLRDLLLDLLAQRGLTSEWELLVVDDGSPRPVAESIADLCARFLAPVRLLRQANRGGPAARNAGARAARGDLLLFLDQDLRVAPDFLASHRAAQALAGPAAISAYYHNRLAEREGPFSTWYASMCAEWEAGARRGGREVIPGLFEVHPVLLSSTNLSLPRSAFEAAGGFPVFKRTGVEDQALGLELGRQGVRVLRMDSSCPLHVEARARLDSFCARQRIGAAATVELIARFPLTFGPLEATAQHRTNGPARPFQEAMGLTARKAAKALLASRALRSPFRALVGWLERAFPGSRALARCYSLLVGVSIQEGWREGLKDRQP